MAWINLTNLGKYHEKLKAWIEKNKYVHPANHPATMIVQDTLNQFVSKEQKDKWNNKLDSDANAVSASKLQTPVSINGIPFDGTQDVDINTNICINAEKEIKKHFQLNSNETIITIPEEMLFENGILNFYIDGIKLTENINYTVDFEKKQITLLEAYISPVNVEMTFVKLHRFEETFSDFIFQIEDGHLVLYTSDNGKLPNFFLEDGHLIMEID